MFALSPELALKNYKFVVANFKNIRCITEERQTVNCTTMQLTVFFFNKQKMRGLISYKDILNIINSNESSEAVTKIRQLCELAQGNQHDRFRKNKNSSSVYRGVSFANGWQSGKGVVYTKPWMARMPIDKSKGIKKIIHLGYHKTQNEAAEAYNKKELQIYGDKAILNEIIDNPTIRDDIKILLERKPKINRINLSPLEAVEVIKLNTDEKNRSDNDILIEYISGDDARFAEITNKYYPVWKNTLKKKQKHYNDLKSKQKRVRTEYPHTIDDVISTGLIQAMGALKRGKFDGRNFKSWSTRVLIVTQIMMYKKEEGRRKLPMKNPEFFDYNKLWEQV